MVEKEGGSLWADYISKCEVGECRMETLTLAVVWLKLFPERIYLQDKKKKWKFWETLKEDDIMYPIQKMKHRRKICARKQTREKKSNLNPENKEKEEDSLLSDRNILQI